MRETMLTARDDRDRHRSLMIATVAGAFVSAVGFSRFGLRPWQALPIGLGVLLGVHLVAAAFAARAASRRRGS